MRRHFPAWSAALLLALTLTPADAHDVRFGRMVHVRLLDGAVEAAMVVVLHAGPEARVVRDRFDADGDGTLQAAERDALRAWFAAEAVRDFRVSADGWPLAFEQDAGLLDLRGDRGVAAGEELQFRVGMRSEVVLRADEVVIADAPANAREEIAIRVDADDARAVEGYRATVVPVGGGSWQVLLNEAGEVVVRGVGTPP